MKRLAFLAAAGAFAVSFNVQAQDTAAAEALIKKSGCLKCHSVSADKDGPSFKKTAAKYKGNADAAAALQSALKSGKMKVDGKDVKHAVLKGDDGQIKNVVAYILSR